jgi:hypothetical protein
MRRRTMVKIWTVPSSSVSNRKPSMGGWAGTVALIGQLAERALDAIRRGFAALQRMLDDLDSAAGRRIEAEQSRPALVAQRCRSNRRPFLFFSSQPLPLGRFAQKRHNVTCITDASRYK